MRYCTPIKVDVLFMFICLQCIQRNTYRETEKKRERGKESHASLFRLASDNAPHFSSKCILSNFIESANCQIFRGRIGDTQPKIKEAKKNSLPYTSRLTVSHTHTHPYARTTSFRIIYGIFKLDTGL